MEKDCPICRGSGQWHGIPCLTCDGSGTIPDTITLDNWAGNGFSRRNKDSST